MRSQGQRVASAWELKLRADTKTPIQKSLHEAMKGLALCWCPCTDWYSFSRKSGDKEWKPFGLKTLWLQPQPQYLADLCYREGSISLSLPAIYKVRGMEDLLSPFSSDKCEGLVSFFQGMSILSTTSIQICHSSCPQGRNDSLCFHPYKHSGPLPYSAKGRRSSLQLQNCRLTGRGWLSS